MPLTDASAGIPRLGAKTVLARSRSEATGASSPPPPPQAISAHAEASATGNMRSRGSKSFMAYRAVVPQQDVAADFGPGG